MKRLKRKKQTFWGLGVLLLGLGPLSAIVCAQTYLYNQAGLGVGNKPSSITVTDFNGDGRLDLAVTNQSDNTVSVILGGLDGSFAPQVDYQVGTAPVALVNGDFNGDHIPDLAVINSQDNTVSFAHAHGPRCSTTGAALLSHDNSNQVYVGPALAKDSWEARATFERAPRQGADPCGPNATSALQFLISSVRTRPELD